MNSYWSIYFKSIFSVKILKKGLISFLYAYCLNLNGRIYTTLCAKQIIDQFYQNKSNGKIMFGQVGFPDGSATEIRKISHIVHDLKILGDIVYANIEVLNNQPGKIVSNCANKELVFRTRAMGMVDQNNTVHIQELISIDAVPRSEDSFNGII